MADPRTVGTAGASVAATAAKASRILINAVQLIGDAPADVQQALAQLQAVSSSVVRLTEQLQSSPTAEWSSNWLGEVSRIVDATATEVNALQALLARWDQLRNANQIQATWPGFRSAISSDQLAQASRRAELAKSAILLLTSAVQLSSTPAINTLIGQARDKINALLSEQTSDPTPATPVASAAPAHTPHHSHAHHNGTIVANGMVMGAAMVNGGHGYTMAPYQTPPLSPPEQPPPYEQTSSTYPIRPTNRGGHQQVGYFLVSVAAHAQQEAGIAALRQDIATRARRVTELESEVSELKARHDEEIAEIVTLKDEVMTRDRRIGELEAELAEFKTLNRRSSTASMDNQDQLFRDMVSKYKGVKKLYFEAKGEISTLSRQVTVLKKTGSPASTSASPVSPVSESATDGRDKVIEAWKQKCEELSKQIRTQEESEEATIRDWREKYDTLMAQHMSLEDVARTAEELQGEMERIKQELEIAENKIRNQVDEISASHKALADAQRMLEENDNVYSGKLAALEHEKEHIQLDLENRLSQVEAERQSQLESERSQLQVERSQAEVERQEKVKALEAVRRLTALWQEAQKVMAESGLDG